MCSQNRLKKRCSLVVILVRAFVVCASIIGGSAAAFLTFPAFGVEVRTTQVSQYSDDYWLGDPSISGPRVAWVANPSRPVAPNIWVHDLRNGSEWQITHYSDDYALSKPSIWNDKVAWSGNPNRPYEPNIWVHDLDTGTATQITNFSGDYMLLQVSMWNDLIVWKGNPSKNWKPNIWLLDVNTGGLRQITDYSGNYYLGNPSISDGKITWRGNPNYPGVPNIWVHDLNTGATEQVTNFSGNYILGDPSISQGRIAWRGNPHDNFKPNIWALDLNTRTMDQITHFSGNYMVGDPSISGRQYAWRGNPDRPVAPNVFLTEELRPMLATTPGDGEELSFGVVRIGDSSARMITAMNSGPAGTQLTGGFPSGAGEFGPAGTSSFGPLSSGGSASREYSYAPSNRGTDELTVSVTSDGGSSTIDLTGAGVGPEFSSTPEPGSPLDFGNLDIGTTQNMFLDIRNISTDSNGGDVTLTDLTLLNAALTGPDAGVFSLLGFTPGTVLSKNDSLSVQLRVAHGGPGTEGAKQATLTLFSDQGAPFAGNGSSFSFNLAAELLPPEAHTWSPVGPSADWASASNWDPPGTPAPNWGAVLRNDSAADPKQAVVHMDSTVSTVEVWGTAGVMNLVVEAGATLTVDTFDNSGTVTVDGTITGTLNNNSGGVLKGSGTVGILNLNDGGTLAPGDSTGTMAAGDTTFGPGGFFELEINDFAGTAGDASLGWDLLSVAGTLTLTATADNPLQLDLLSLTAAQTAGPAENFDNMQGYSLTFVATTGGISGFDAHLFRLDPSSFQNDLGGGTFWIGQSGNDLHLNFTPIPEPSTLAMAAMGLLGLAFYGWRRRAGGR